MSCRWLVRVQTLDLIHSGFAHTDVHTVSVLKESSKVDEVNEVVLAEGGQVMKVRPMERESFCA